MESDKRQHPRVESGWPTFILANNGFIAAETKDICEKGALLKCSNLPDPEENFVLLMKPARTEFMKIHASKVWTEPVPNSSPKVHLMGVRFVEMSDATQKFLHDTIIGYLKS